MEQLISLQTACLAFFFLLGLLFSGLLLARAREYSHRPSYWLSLFVLLCSCYLVPFMMGYSGWYGKDGYREFLLFIPFQQFFLIGPVIWFYTKSLLDDSFQLRGKDWLHLLPAALYLLYSLVVFVSDVFLLEDYYFYADGWDKDLAPWYQFTGLLAMIAYFAISLRHYNAYRKRIVDELSYADTVTFRWMKQYLIALLFIMLVRVAFLLLLPSLGSFGKWFWYYLIFAALFCFIALAGYTNAIRAQLVGSGAKPKRSPPPSPEPKAESSPGLDNQDLDLFKPRILHLMETERIYENPTLTLTDVADALGTTSKQVSQVINQGFELNFNDFVNHYRVEAVKKRFAAGEQEQFTILSIALGCGFNSKTTFNRVFKRRTGMTPQQYLSGL